MTVVPRDRASIPSSLVRVSVKVNADSEKRRPITHSFEGQALIRFISSCQLILLLFGSSLRATEPVETVHLNSSQIERLKQTSPLLQKLITAAAPSIGTRYLWGGTNLESGIDCSNFTWQLYQKMGLPYDRYLGTQFMSRIYRNGALSKTTFKKARPGDLLVYGYTKNRKWYGHVVILIDKDGKRSGVKGLTLGAHGGDINAVQYITYKGFESGYFKHPQMKLANVLTFRER